MSNSKHVTSQNNKYRPKLPIQNPSIFTMLGGADWFGVLNFFHPTPQSSPDVANFYRGTIVELNPQLEFKLDCCSQRLQLGLVKTEDQSQENLSSIKSLMEQYELSCTATNMGERQVDVDTVYCSTSDGLISGLLVSEGLVKENCEASANQFVTCD